MSTITLSDHQKAQLYASNRKYIEDAYKATPIFYDKLFKLEKETHVETEVVANTKLTVASKVFEGDNLPFSKTRELYDKKWRQEMYGLGVALTLQAIKFNKYPKILPKNMTSLKDAHIRTREFKAHGLVNNGFTTTDTTEYGADGVRLFSDSHVTAGAVQSNIVTRSDFTEAAIESMVTLTRNMKDNSGNQLAVMPRKVVVPNSLEFEAARILRSSGRAGTANNDINALREMDSGRLGLDMSPYLTGDAFYLTTSVQDNEGLKLWESHAPEFIEHENTGTNLAMLYMMIQFFQVGFEDWRAIVGNQGPV